MKRHRIYLSPPYQSGEELKTLNNVLESNWISTAGEELLQFEKRLSQLFNYNYVTAVSSGTSALHLILNLIGVGSGDEVIVSNFTFIAAVNPILYLGGIPVLVDSEPETWNMSPELLQHCLEKKKKEGGVPKALVLVHLYGMPAKLAQIKELCSHFSVLLIEDTAEALGSSYENKYLGTFGDYGFLSFNGNKIVTTAGGGAVVSNSRAQYKRLLYLSTQARQNCTYYQHNEVGYNYRLSNVLAALGLAQLADFEFRLKQKREIYKIYRDELSSLGFGFLPNPKGCNSNRWLTCITHPQIDPVKMTIEFDRKHNIEIRPLWKPMHLQPIYKNSEMFINGCSESLFNSGVCLPSGIGTTETELGRVIDAVKSHIK